jgi:hypothetical protein
LIGFTWTFVPLEDRIDVVSALVVGAVEAEDVDEVEDHVDEAEEERTPKVLDATRTAADPNVHDGSD